VKLYDFKGDIELFAKYFMNNEGIFNILELLKRLSQLKNIFFSYIYSVFQSRSGCLVQKESPKHAFLILRRYERSDNKILCVP